MTLGPFSDIAPELVRSIADFALVFILVYVVLKLIWRTRAIPAVLGIVLLSFLYWISIWQKLQTVEFVLRVAVLYIGFAVIVLFQTEIRQALIYLGNRFQMLSKPKSGQIGDTIYDEIVLAITTLSSQKIGALIVLERGVGLKNFIDSGVQVDSKLSYDLLVTIFHPTTPLHDGAVVISENRIMAASVFLPLTKNPNVSRDLGTRHRAAIGVTEGSDAIAIVVSEETGAIGYVENGEMRRNVDAPQLKRILLDSLGLSPKSSDFRKKKTGGSAAGNDGRGIGADSSQISH